MNRYFLTERVPQAETLMPVQPAPVATRLIKGARTVCIEAAMALHVAFGPDKAAAMNAAAAAALAMGPPLTVGHVPVPDGAKFLAIVAANKTTRYAVAKVTLGETALDPNTLQPLAA